MPIIEQINKPITPTILFAIKFFNRYMINIVIPIKITPSNNIFGL